MRKIFRVFIFSPYWSCNIFTTNLLTLLIKLEKLLKLKYYRKVIQWQKLFYGMAREVENNFNSTKSWTRIASFESFLHFPGWLYSFLHSRKEICTAFKNWYNNKNSQCLTDFNRCRYLKLNQHFHLIVWVITIFCFDFSWYIFHHFNTHRCIPEKLFIRPSNYVY